MERLCNLPAKGIRRYALLRIRQVLSIVDGLDREEAENIHAVRLATKRLRAAWRLLRSGVGNEVRKRADQRLRAAGKSLAENRDAHVRCQTLTQLAEGARQPALIRAYEDVLALLAGHSEIGKSVNWARVKDAFASEEKAWVNLPATTERRNVLIHGLQWTYDNASKKAKRATALGGRERYHDWRRHAKYLLYQLEMIPGLNPASLSIYHPDLKKLGRTLGRHHDLALLREQISTMELPEAEAWIRLPIVRDMREVERRLARQCRVLERRLFALPPKRFLYEFIDAAPSEAFTMYSSTKATR